MNDSEIIVIRPYAFERDAALIFSSWRNAVWFDSHKTDKIDTAFYHRKTKEIKKILEDSGTETRVACLKTNPDFLVGYAVINKRVIEFVYVKLDYRKQGIASILCKGLSAAARPTTRVGVSIVRRLGIEVKENNGQADGLQT